MLEGRKEDGLRANRGNCRLFVQKKAARLAKARTRPKRPKAGPFEARARAGAHRRRQGGEEPVGQRHHQPGRQWGEHQPVRVHGPLVVVPGVCAWGGGRIGRRGRAWLAGGGVGWQEVASAARDLPQSPPRQPPLPHPKPNPQASNAPVKSEVELDGHGAAGLQVKQPPGGCETRRGSTATNEAGRRQESWTARMLRATLPPSSDQPFWHPGVTLFVTRPPVHRVLEQLPPQHAKGRQPRKLRGREAQLRHGAPHQRAGDGQPQQGDHVPGWKGGGLKYDLVFEL